MLRKAMKITIIISVILILLFDFGILFLNICKRNKDGVSGWRLMYFVLYVSCAFISRQGIFIDLVYEASRRKMTKLDCITPAMTMVFLTMISCLAVDALVLVLIQASIAIAMLLTILFTFLYSKKCEDQTMGNGHQIIYLVKREGDGIIDIV